MIASNSIHHKNEVMKKYVYIIVTAVLAIQLLSCSKNDDEPASVYSKRDVTSRSYIGNSTHLLGGQIPGGGTNTKPNEGQMFYEENMEQSASVSPTELSFPADGGTQTVTITAQGYNHYDFSIDDDYTSWLSAKTIEGGHVEITAEPNGTRKKRVGYVCCFVSNKENPTEGQKRYLIPIEVTQAAGEWEGDYELLSGKVEMYYAHAWKLESAFKATDDNVTITPIKKGAKVKIELEGEDYAATWKYTINFEIDDLSQNDSGLAQISNYKYEMVKDITPYDYYIDHVDWGKQITRMEAPEPQLSYSKGYWYYYKNDIVYYYKSTLHYDVWHKDYYSKAEEKTIETETTEVTDGSRITIYLDIKKK